MNRIRLLCALAVAFIATAAAGQTGVCSGGTVDPFFKPQFGSGGVWIYYETKKYIDASGTSVYVNGNKIAVSQVVGDAPPISPPPGVTLPTCIGFSLPVGKLAPGTYDVTWTYGAVLIEEPVATYHFTIVVPADVPVPLLDRRLLAALALVVAAIGARMLR